MDFPLGPRYKSENLKFLILPQLWIPSEQLSSSLGSWEIAQQGH